MNAIHLPGLAGEIAHYLNEQAPVAAPRLAVGGAVSLLSAIVGMGWELPHIDIYSREVLRRILKCPDHADFPATRPIRQNVMLVAPVGHGKGGIVAGVERLLCELEKARPAASAFWDRLLILEHFDHLDCAGMELEAEGVHRVRGFISPKRFDRLQDSSLCLLSESTPDDFVNLLPFWYESSVFYGQCLMVQHHGPRGARNYNPGGKPPGALLGNLAVVADLALSRQAGQKVMLEVTDEATAWYRLHWHQDMDDYCEYGPMAMQLQLGFQAMQVAAIVAVGIDPLRPIVTAKLFHLASDIVSESVRLARSGLRPAGE